MPGARRAIVSCVSVAETTARSYVTSRGPKQAGQTYARAIGWVRPQLRQVMPTRRAGAASASASRVVVVGDVSVSIVMAWSPGYAARRGAGTGVRDDPDRFEGAPKSSLISQEDLPGIGTLPASRR